MKWQSIRLREVAERITKGTTPTTLGRPFTTEGVNFIKAEALNGDSGLDCGSFSFIDEQTHELLRRSMLQEGDVLITIAGAQIGKCAFVKAEHTPANTNQAVGIIRINAEKVASRFVYYFFKQASTFSLIQSLGAQAAQPNLNLARLGQIAIRLPPRAEQTRIAGVLSAYDDLIENNRRRMALLEKAARLLYEEWFVRLRFPGHERTHLASSGLPKGWERKPLSELTTFLRRGITPDYDDSADGLVINQKCIRDGRLHLRFARRQSRAFGPDRQLRVGDVLVNSTGEGTLGRIAQVKHTIENCAVDTHVTIVRPRPEIPIHYFGLAVMAWEPQLSTMGRGATNQTELSSTTIGEAEIVLPPWVLMNEFQAIAAPVYDQVTNLTSQSEKARSARDLLLPRLMSGEISL